MNPQSILCGLISGLLFIPTTIFGMTWGVRFLQEARGREYEAAVTLAATVPLGWMIGCPLLGFISDKLGRRKRQCGDSAPGTETTERGRQAMNTQKLGQMYPWLTPQERLPLIVAASIRGDQAERRRLVESAPMAAFQVPDYFGLGNALAEISHLHLLTLLELAASFWQWWGMWLATGSAHGPQRDTGKTGTEEEREFRLYGMVRYHAYRFSVHSGAWKQFCSEANLDPEA